MSQRARSPVLGYNHNVRHGGRVFHVQTEDSGTGYARLYTHLFFEGTILSSKKMEYDADAPEDQVRGLMQKQHKAMIKELSHGDHDVRIAGFFSARGQPARVEDAAVSTSGVVAPPESGAPVAPMPVQATLPITAVPALAVAPVAAASGRTPPPAVAAASGGTPAPVVAHASGGTPAPARVPAKPVVVVKPGALKRPPVVLSSSADGVVVRRNVVVNVGGGAPPVVGAGAPAVNGPAAPSSGTPPPVVAPRPRVPVATSGDGMFVGAGPVKLPATTPRGGPAPQPLASSRDIRMPWETPAPARVAPPIVQPILDQPSGPTTREVRMPWESGGPPAPADAFAADLVNDKSLDEVILEYLSDDSEETSSQK